MRGRTGEGPKEYVYIQDMYLSDDALYIIDMKQKLLCFGLDGTFRWEIHTKKWYQRILGVKGETFYMPEKVDSQAGIFSFQNRSAVFSNGYLLYFDPETVGFKIFRLKL